jgi:adenine-specific DNA-methyltransferase
MPTLNWHKREEAVRAATRAPYRLLEPVAELSYGDADSENLLIQGDNLDALKALLPYYAGRVKCIAIDPPYNTRSAFQHYDDNLEHSLWLSLMYPRLELLRDLLAEDGSIWVNIDDFELHYLKVLMDEVFGRKNFVTTIVWQMRTSRENRRVFSNNHEYMLVYAMNPERWSELRNDLELTDEVRSRYKNPDNDPRGPWQSVSANAQAGHGTPDQFYVLTAPSGKKHELPKGRCWLYTESRIKEEIAKGNIWYGKDGKGAPRIKKFLSEVKAGLTPETLWLADEVGTNDFAKKALLQVLKEQEVFETPKPETLLQRVVHIATNPGDLVLDSFLGSATTAATAHKMGRRWIGIELGDHAVTHCVPRLKKVVDGEQGGISEAVGWKGGGGFRFCRLGPPIFDENDHINCEIRFPVLAAHVWFSETHTPLAKAGKSALLGVHKDTAYYLLYNGILGDKRPGGGNVLTGKVLGSLARHDGPKVIYGECTSLGEERLRREGVVFKQIPYDVKRR